MPPAGAVSSASSPASRPATRAPTRASSSPTSPVAARTLYEDLYCRRGQAENHIKSWKTHLAADRTSFCRAAANQLRLMLHTGAYWLRRLMPARSSWRVAQFDTLRLRLLKIATRVVEWKTRVMLHLPSACPDQAILRLVLERIPRLVIGTAGQCCPERARSTQPQALQSAPCRWRPPPAGESARRYPSGRPWQRRNRGDPAIGRVEDGCGSLGHLASPRFPSPLIKPDVRISRIRLSD